MYICMECGHIFEDGEEKRWVESHGLDSPPYEHLSGCPICWGAYTYADICCDCGGAFLPEKLYSGHYCEDCLRASIDYDSAFEYLAELGYLEDFVFDKYYGCCAPGTISDKLRNDLRERYRRQKADDQIRGVTEFLMLIEQFILEDDGETGRETYAEWLYKKELKSCQSKNTAVKRASAAPSFGG